MKRLGLLKALRLCAAYGRLGPAGRASLQQSRLRAVIAHARQNSPYYRRLYAGLPMDAPLSSLPPVDKRGLMADWDAWPTDRDLHLSDIQRFMEDQDNIGRKMNGKYLIFTTSGSTGEPLIMACDSSVNAVMGAVNAQRAFARREDLRAFILRGGKTMGVFATGGFYLSNGSVRARQLSLPWKAGKMAVTSALLPTAEIVAQLNAFQPALLGGYPSNLDLLMDEAESLHIAPVVVMAGGERLTDDVRRRLREVFHCTVQTSYACTEGGTLACECAQGHLHINDDWVHLEPVDAQDRPVPDGVLSDHILMTNLFNYTQPFIRYVITDRVILHREGCACGNPSPWLEVEGRTDDVIALDSPNGTERLPPLALYAVLKEAGVLRRFQLIADGRGLSLRVEPMPGLSREAAFDKAAAALTDFLEQRGITGVPLTLSPDPPRSQPGSGKFKHIVNGAG